MQILVAKTADEATAALAEGDRFLAELSRHLKAGSPSGTSTRRTSSANSPAHQLVPR
jgi:hypothetical protein